MSIQQKFVTFHKMIILISSYFPFSWGSLLPTPEAPTQQNGQTHSNNSFPVSDELLECV